MVRFVLPVVQGFVEAIPVLVGQYEGHLTLVARRRNQRPGVRHWRRGCDPQVFAPSSPRCQTFSSPFQSFMRQDLWCPSPMLHALLACSCALARNAEGQRDFRNRNT